MKILYILSFFAFILILSGCSQNADQHAFEQEAISNPPSGIMAMTANATHKKGTESDESDWQIAPRFQGLVDVSIAAYPNPVTFNTRFQIELFVRSIESVVGLNVYAFQQPDVPLNSLAYSIEGELPTGSNSIPIIANFANSSSTGTAGNIYRILIYDGRNRLITYGDVEIQ